MGEGIIKYTGKKCIVCGGDIVELIVNEYNPKTGPPIVGPGSKGQFHEVSKGFHCESCRLKYADLLIAGVEKIKQRRT